MLCAWHRSIQNEAVFCIRAMFGTQIYLYIFDGDEGEAKMRYLICRYTQWTQPIPPLSPRVSFSVIIVHLLTEVLKLKYKEWQYPSFVSSLCFFTKLGEYLQLIIVTLSSDFYGFCFQQCRICTAWSCSGSSLQYQLDGRLGGPQSQSVPVAKRKNSILLSRIERRPFRINQNLLVSRCCF